MRPSATVKAMHRLLAFACGALAAMVFCLACFVVFSNEQPPGETTIETTAFSVGEKPMQPIPAVTYMPMYLQTDAQWSGCDYAGGTIADSGCGLACAAMAVKYLTTQDVTPLTVADAVGDACLTDGVNDTEKFAEWISTCYESYAIETTSKFYMTSEALTKVADGWVCFAGLSGAFGDSDYGGHAVLIWRVDDSSYWVRDPASPANSARAFSEEELGAVDFRYFVGVRGGYYGNARH